MKRLPKSRFSSVKQSFKKKTLTRTMKKVSRDKNPKAVAGNRTR